MGGKKRDLIKEFVSFNIVGITNTIITYIIYSVLVFLGIHYIVSLVFDYCFGIAFSFFLNRKFTFHHTGKVTARMIISMIGSYLVVFGINIILLMVLVEKFMFNKYIAQLIAVTTTVLFSFFAQKFIVFSKRHNP